MSDLPQLTIQQIAARANDTSFERGQNYYRQGAIFAPVRRGGTLECYCAGSGPLPYHVMVECADDAIITASCTCPYDWGGDCKHVVALLLMFVHEPETFAERPTLDELLAAHSKEALIALVKTLLRQAPQLMELVDPETPGLDEFLQAWDDDSEW
ncbi:MAG: SWIM zinc finger family protein [Anaerolineae bacterium]|nr:SWIM zinc finger family protein [Anaerolineae bacterium]